MVPDPVAVYQGKTRPWDVRLDESMVTPRGLGPPVRLPFQAGSVPGGVHLYHKPRGAQNRAPLFCRNLMNLEDGPCPAQVAEGFDT